MTSPRKSPSTSPAAWGGAPAVRLSRSPSPGPGAGVLPLSRSSSAPTRSPDRDREILPLRDQLASAAVITLCHPEQALDQTASPVGVEFAHHVVATSAARRRRHRAAPPLGEQQGEGGPAAVAPGIRNA